MSPDGGLRSLYVKLVITGLVGNVGSFITSQSMISSGLVYEGSPHMGELMGGSPMVWLVGISILSVIYGSIYVIPIPYLYRTYLASAPTALSVSNLTHDLSVLLPSHYLHIVITLIPAISIPIATSITVEEMRKQEQKMS